MMAEFLKSVGFIGLSDKKMKCPIQMAYLSAQMSDKKKNHGFGIIPDPDIPFPSHNDFD
jgi:hypothetical protein